jgi:ribosome-binding protein aMBF1 (putative translation factor)
MARTTLTELKNRRVAAMTPEENAVFDATYESTRLAIDVGDKVRDAREAAGISQRDLATRMGTSQAAVRAARSGRCRSNPHYLAKGRRRTRSEDHDRTLNRQLIVNPLIDAARVMTSVEWRSSSSCGRGGT